MNSQKFRGFLLFISILIALAVITIYIQSGVAKAPVTTLQEVFLQAEIILMLFLANYASQRVLSLLAEPSIHIDEKSLNVGGFEHVVIKNSDQYNHPEIKIYFEIYDKVTLKSGRVQSALLVHCTNISLGSISRGRGLRKPGTLYVKIPKETIAELTASRTGTSAQVEVKITSVHRFTNARGLTRRNVTVPISKP